MAKLFDQPIKDAHIILESGDDGQIDLRVSYPFSKLEAPVAVLLGKLVAKIPVLKRYQTSVPGAVSAIFARFGVKSPIEAIEDALIPKAADPQPEAQPVAAHEAHPVPPLHTTV